MKPDGLRRCAATISRQAVLLVLAGVAFRYGAPLVFPLPAIVLYSVGWLLVAFFRVGYGTVLTVTAALPAVLLVAVELVGRVAVVPPGGAMENLVVLAPYALLPALLTVPPVFAWEWWASSRRSGRLFFSPLVAVLVLGALWTQAGFRTELFSHPWHYAVLSLVLVLFLGIHQLTVPGEDVRRRFRGHQARNGNAAARDSVTDSLLLPMLYQRADPSGVRWGRRLFSSTVLLVLILLALFGVYRSRENQAVTAGGGLLRPSMFRFDFADVISLESEIRLNTDLVMLYREDHPPPDRLLRRYVLSGYSPRRGFYRLDASEEPSPVPPLSVRDAARGLSPVEGSRVILQEYHIVNFDPDALIAVTEPSRVAIRGQPPGSSFNAAYNVRSLRTERTPARLRSVPWPASLPPRWDEVYLETEVPAGVAALAREITAGITGYYDTVKALEDHLLREYRYSLVPGDALDGDQLSHFLFESRKGYCSYFAFSMALMARSLGIPARVAAGFFIVPETGMLGFHPVRGDMAHAWVEVYFPDIGWVEFDPTSQELAPGEIVSTDYQIDRERLAGLVQEILDAPGEETMEVEPPPGVGVFSGGLDAVVRVLRDRWYLFLATLVILSASLRRLRWRRLRKKDPAAAAMLLFRHLHRIVIVGTPEAVEPDRDEAERPSRNRTNRLPVTTESLSTAPLAAMPYPLHAVGRIASRARLGPDFSHDDLLDLDREYTRALHMHRGELLRRRRRSAALIALIRGAAVPSRWGTVANRRGLGAGRRGTFFRGGTLLVLAGSIILFAAGPTTNTLPAQEPGAQEPGAQEPGAQEPGAQEPGAQEPGPTQPEPTQPEPTQSEPTQQPDSPADRIDRLETEIHRAINAENFEEALRRIARARQAYPEESRFPLLEGDLFYDQELYLPAEAAYREALALGASEYHTRYVLARTLARLNRDNAAIEELEALNLVWPDDSIVAGDLAWLYFKRHRLHDARDLLEQFLNEYGSTRDLHMTLATVYAGLYDYEAALEVYDRAIREARADEDRFFQAVAYYNLSILHANFHRWQEAMDAAERSLTATERSSGYMIRAELAYRRMDLDRSVTDYLRADTLDRETPLPGLSLAAIWSAIGHPDRAIQRMNRIVQRDNANWMYSYGTDPERYQLRVYSILADSYEAAARHNWLFRPGSLFERVLTRLRSVGQRILAWYYRGLHRRQSLQVARVLEIQGRTLPASWLRMHAAEHRPAVALSYSARAEALETSFNPDALVDYKLFAARLNNDATALGELTRELGSPWRAVERVEALRELYRYHGHRSAAGLAAAADLYALAPGSFLVNGLRIPVSLEAGAGTALTRREVARRLRRLGFRIVPDGPLRLALSVEEGRLDYTLVYREPSRGEQVVLREGNVRFAPDRDDADRQGMIDALEETARLLTRSQLPGGTSDQ